MSILMAGRRDCRVGAAMILGLILTCCSHDGQRPRTTKLPTIQGEQFAVGGISLDSTEAEVVSALGNPLEVQKSLEDGGVPEESMRYRYEGLEIDLAHGKVFGVRCSSSRYHTPDGVTVGDTKEKVFRVYGATEVQDRGDDELAWYKVEGTDEHLVFRFRDQRVHRIDLWFPVV